MTTNMDWCGIGQLVEEMRKEHDAASQNAPISHKVAPGSIKTAHPYPPYGLEEIVAHKGTSEGKA